jgi:hypothetical protein
MVYHEFVRGGGRLMSKNVSTVIMSLSVWRTANEQFGRRHQNVASEKRSDSTAPLSREGPIDISYLKDEQNMEKSWYDIKCTSTPSEPVGSPSGPGTCHAEE